MSAARASIALLRFCAGDLHCGLVAAAVESMGDATTGCPRLCDILDVPQSEGSQQRTVRLFAYGRRTQFLVDGPTGVITIGGSDLLPTARALRVPNGGPVLGFAKDAAHIVLLLDVKWLVERTP